MSNWHSDAEAVHVNYSLKQNLKKQHSFKNTQVTRRNANLFTNIASSRNDQLHISLYDKRTDINFHISQHFRSYGSNIPSSSAYGMFIFKLIWYVGAYSLTMNCLFWEPNAFSTSF